MKRLRYRRGAPVWFAVLALFCGLWISSSTLAVAPPTHISALLYSTSAAELFWTPADGQRVLIWRNGASLGVFDARSLFQPELDPAQPYAYVLQSVSAKGELSESISITLSTGGFNLPIKRILPDAVDPANPLLDDAIAPPPPLQVAESASPPVADPTLEAQDSAAGSTGSGPTGVVQPRGDSCHVDNLNDLLNCVKSARAHANTKLEVHSDLSCVGAQCCPGGQALLNLYGVSGMSINGNGKRLLRQSGQRNCSLLDIEDARSVTLKDWHLDDDAEVAGCRVEDECPRMLHVKRSRNIRLERVIVSNGKGYTIYVQGVDGFAFIDSELNNSGVLGMYLGHGNQPSTNIHIEGSVFRDNQTNALALLGVTGNNVTDNDIVRNVFIRNHRRGQWQVLPQYGTGYTGGGQVYFAEANHVTFRDNRILDGYCENCFVQKRARSGVSGLELGRRNQRSVSDLVISNNLIMNHDGHGVSKNANSLVDSSVQLTNNQYINNTSGSLAAGAAQSGNRISNTQYFYSFESDSIFQSAFTNSVRCSSQAIVERQCGAESRYGQCSARIEMAAADCGAAHASLIGPKTPISAGQIVSANAWVSGGPGEWCLVFTDTYDDIIDTKCVLLKDGDTSAVQSFVGTPVLQYRSPDQSANVQVLLRNTLTHSVITVDDIKVAVE